MKKIFILLTLSLFIKRYFCSISFKSNYIIIEKTKNKNCFNNKHINEKIILETSKISVFFMYFQFMILIFFNLTYLFIIL